MIRMEHRFSRIEGTFDERYLGAAAQGKPVVGAIDIRAPGLAVPTLAKDKESGIGGGDSGGPAFMRIGDEYFLVGTRHV